MKELEKERTAGVGYLEVGTEVVFPHDLPDGSTELLKGKIIEVVEDGDISFYIVFDDQGYMHRIALRGVWIRHNPWV